MECTICFHPLIQVNSTSTACAHTFCTDCLNDWLKHSNECPICRTNLVETENRFVSIRINSDILNNTTFNDSPGSSSIISDGINARPLIRQGPQQVVVMLNRKLLKGCCIFALSGIILLGLTRDF